MLLQRLSNGLLRTDGENCSVEFISTSAYFGRGEWGVFFFGEEGEIVIWKE